ncbi:MAG: hypothetical protein HY898_17175 [Deltaproteobacteria bacterium]|nr:hypothetical protein [Deltaproteobacteria bacterium]
MKKLSLTIGLLLAATACGPSEDPGAWYGSNSPVSSSKGKGDQPGTGGTAGQGSGGQGSGGQVIGQPEGGGPASKEVCGDGLDNDGNGKIDETCACEVGKTQKCFAGDPAQAGKGECTFGSQTCVKATGGNEFQGAEWGECVGSGKPGSEACDGKDNDCNGTVDDGCECQDGDKQDCSTVCGNGSQTCTAGKWGECDALQPDANGNCFVQLNINVDGDCVCAPACPANAPFPVGCQIDFQGGNSNGCVALAGNGQLYFQEGVKCDAGHLTGFVICSSVPGDPLNAQNCPINKSNPHYGQKPSDCPDIEGGDPQSCYY